MCFCGLIVVALITAFAATAELLNNAVTHARVRGASGYDGSAELVVRVFERSIEYVDTPANKLVACIAFSVLASIVIAYVDTADVIRRTARVIRARVLDCSIKAVLFTFIWYVCARATVSPAQCKLSMKKSYIV